MDFREDNELFLDLNDSESADVFLLRVPKGVSSFNCSNKLYILHYLSLCVLVHVCVQCAHNFNYLLLYYIFIYCDIISLTVSW